MLLSVLVKTIAGLCYFTGIITELVLFNSACTVKVHVLIKVHVQCMYN